MKELIDLYVKLVIATFSFIGPSFTLLISLFYNAIRKSQEEHKRQAKIFEVIAKVAAENTIIQKDFIEFSERRAKRIRREADRLNPKREARRLFGSLLLSLLLIGFYYFQHSRFCSFYNQNIRIAAVVLSGLIFSLSLLILWQIFCTIIRIKGEEEEAKAKAVNNLPLANVTT